MCLPVRVHVRPLGDLFPYLLQKFILITTKFLRMVDATLYYLISKGGIILELFALNSENWAVRVEE